MDYSKTGHLIAKKRKDRNYTLEELSKLLRVSPQAISLWENGRRFPDPSSQIMLFKVLGLNPVELHAGLEMFEDDLKAGIANYMNRIDENIYFTAGTVTDEDGNDIMVYHARTETKIEGDPLYNPNRHAMLMKVRWNDDGTPLFSYE